MDGIEACVEALKAQVRSYKARRVKLSEADTLRVLITPLLEALGWATREVEEVRNEYRHERADNPVDVALFLNRTPVLFVEAKALGESLDERRWMVQTINYANTSGVEWCVLTNGNEYRFYKVHAQVQVEDKLFIAIVLDDDTPTELKARKLALIGRERMGQRAIDDLWTKWRVDRQVAALFEALPSDDTFLRLVAKKSEGRLRIPEIRESLRRATIRIDYPAFADVVEAPGAEPAIAESIEPPGFAEPPAPPPTPPPSPATAPARTKRVVTRGLMRTPEMVALGLLPIGTPLTIRGRPESTATVVDGKEVLFQGERMGFNEWGCRVTGWTSIRIYEWAVLPDGRVLGELRTSQ